MQSTQISVITALLFVVLHTTTSDKSNYRPVYEVINEQARIDDDLHVSNSPSVPFGNPLAGNRNARAYISNQQAMFNAEKIRQHRAQLQRLSQAPKLDSYMRAYHESQDSHQQAQEQQQATQRENTVTKPPIISRTTPVPKLKIKKRIQNIPENTSRTQNPNQRQETSRRNYPSRKTDGNKSMKYRGQRSYGAEYQQYLNPLRHQFVYLNSEKDKGVTIKPNGNVGVTPVDTTESSKLYTEAIPSDIKNVYPKQFSQMQYYKTVNEAESSDSSSKNNAALSAYTSQNGDTTDIPIDFYFYLKNPSKSVSDIADQTNLIGNNYASDYMSDYTVKDHTPITENVDDIEDPNAFKSTRPFIPQSIPSPTPPLDESTTKTNHYYKIEVASQILTSKHKPDVIKEALSFKQEDDLSPVSHYPTYPIQTDESVRYLHHNAQNIGVQHLSEDGYDLSALGDDVSISYNIKNRQRRSTLDNEAFLLPNEKEPEATTTTDNPVSEPLIRLNPSKKFNNNNFNVFVSPNVPLTNADDDYFQSEQEVDSFYDEYSDYDDSFSDEIGASTNIRPIINVDTNYHLDARDSYVNKLKRNPMYISQIHRRIPKPHPYTYHAYDHLLENNRYNLPLNYGIPRINALANLNDILEPVYMITQTELNQLLNNQKYNIEHVDVYQIPKQNKPKRMSPFPKYHKRSPYKYRNRKIRNKLHKLNKFL